jgi:hypothetical protein
MNPYLIGGAAAVALAAGVALWWQQGQIEDLQERGVQLERAKAAETQARTQWQEQAQACSRATATLKAQGAAQRRAYEASLQQALAGRVAAQAQARAILMAERPAGLDECAAARAELDAEVDRRHP